MEHSCFFKFRYFLNNKKCFFLHLSYEGSPLLQSISILHSIILVEVAGQVGIQTVAVAAVAVVATVDAAAVDSAAIAVDVATPHSSSFSDSC